MDNYGLKFRHIDEWSVISKHVDHLPHVRVRAAILLYVRSTGAPWPARFSCWTDLRPSTQVHDIHRDYSIFFFSFEKKKE